MKDTQQAAIVVKDLYKSFGDVKVLKGVDLTIKHGTVVALLGPNGAGKTTAVRILATLLPADSGQVTVGGYDVARQAKQVRSLIGLTGQYAAIDEDLSAYDNLTIMGRLYRLRKHSIKKRADELLKQFDLVQAARRPVKTYSGGMRRRLDLAISLIAAPPIVFLDEPTTGLDPRSRLGMWTAIKNLAAHGTTILLTTQYLEEADRLADHIAVVDNGKVIAEGTAKDLKQRIGTERLELTMVRAADVAEAQKALGGTGAQVDVERRTVSIATDGSAGELEALLKRINATGLSVENVSLAKPSLDDVFLDLTGRKAQAKSKQKEEEVAS